MDEGAADDGPLALDERAEDPVDGDAEDAPVLVTLLTAWAPVEPEEALDATLGLDDATEERVVGLLDLELGMLDVFEVCNVEEAPHG